MGQLKAQKPRTRVTKNTRTEVMDKKETRAEANRKALESEMDAILDDIDAVLEENAEEFVAAYVQKGGE